MASVDFKIKNCLSIFINVVIIVDGNLDCGKPGEKTTGQYEYFYWSPITHKAVV